MTGLTRPIPDEAQPIVAIIRYGVPRPGELPTSQLSTGKCLRWGDDRRCALGLLSCAQSITPAHANSANIYGLNDGLERFWKWHDNQHDPQALVDALWGPA